jgi:WD40 repeat protein
VGYFAVAKKKHWLSLYNGDLHFFDTEKKFALSIEQPDHYAVQGKRILAAAIHPKEEILAMAVEDETSKKESGIVVRWFRSKPIDAAGQTDDKRPPDCLAFSTDGKLLLTGKGNNILTRWVVELREWRDGTDGMKLEVRRDGTIPLGNGVVTALAAIDDASFAVAIGNRVVRCNARTGNESGELHKGAKPVTALAVSPRSQQFACANGKSVFLYDLKSRAIVDQFDAADTVTALAFDAEGERLASGGKDGKITIRPVKKD